MCGQTLPDDRIEQLKADFERKKAAEKERLENGLAEAKKTFMQEKACTQESIKAEADTLKKKMEDLTKENASLQEQISTLKKKETEALAKQNEAEKELAELPAEADYSQNEEYVKLKARHEEITAQIEAMKSNTDAAETFKEERKQYVAQLDSVKAEIAKASKNVEIEERIGELESEQKEVGQKVADMEKMLYLLESFIKEKMMKISESINSKFNTAVSWKLFDMQLNGGVRTTLHKSDIGKQIGNYNLVIYFTEPSRSKAVEAFLSFYEGNLTVAKKRVTELEEIIKILEESEE
jgi:DNA repair exonuclease SbcCD ATPase subunit